MNPIVFALRHPITVLVAVVGIVLGSVLAVQRVKKDVFPSLNLPVIYVCQPYGGLDPAQMEGLLTYYYEYHFLYITGIHHVESRNIQGTALMKLFFHPGTDMAQAMAETINYVNRSRAFMPPGTVGPFVMRFDTGSVPVGYLVLSTDNPERTIAQMQFQALNRVRPIFATLPGVSAPPPFGGNQRTIVVRVDPDRLRAYQVSPDEVVSALSSGNLISPSGALRVGDQMPLVPTNAMVVNPQELGNIPVRPGGNVYLRDLGYIEDTQDVPTGYALVNGRRTVYMLVTKRADASTLDVVNAVKANLPAMGKAVDPDIRLSFEFDQSPYVTNALWNVLFEAGLGAALTGLMVLLFLRDWRSVLVVVLNIPLALLGALIALWLTGQTLNLMTLGGLALAVGILVDEATVEVENIHTQMERTGSIAQAVRLGNQETAVPRLLAMLCILAVFVPSFLMEGAARALFVPLALTVGFAMVTSYLLSSTFVPVLSVWLLRHASGQRSEVRSQKSEDQERGRTTSQHSVLSTQYSVLSTQYSVLRASYPWLVGKVMSARWLLVPAYLVFAAAIIWLGGSLLGREIFPAVDAGQFQLRLRAPTGTRIERTEELTLQALDVIGEAVGPENVDITIAHVGVVPPSYPINSVYLWMAGPEEAVLRVALKRGSGVRVEDLKERLRGELPERLRAWLRARLEGEGLPPEKIAQRLEGLRFSFEPADIVNEVMSFGSPTPVEIAVSGPSLADNRRYAERVRAKLAALPSLRDPLFVQSLDYPTVEVHIDRERLGQSGGTVKEVASSVLAATSSSRFVVPNYWADPRTGIGFQVQVEIPFAKMNSAQQVGLVPLPGNGEGPLLVRDVAQVREGVMPGQFDRFNMKRLVSLTANIHGEDLGRVAGQVRAALQAVDQELTPEERKQLNVTVDLRGQVTPMEEMFNGLALGLALSVVAILLLLWGYFQSLRQALVVLAAVPAVVAGVIVALLLTRTTLNIQSFMGAIMAIGVAVANAILLVTFAERDRRAGRSAADAARQAAASRVRPILMTSCAMIAGMVPMALGLGDGGEQVAPLGRAVIGGLAAATLTTLLVLPAVFALVQGRGGVGSVSLDPDDPESLHYQPGT